MGIINLNVLHGMWELTLPFASKSIFLSISNREIVSLLDQLIKVVLTGFSFLRPTVIKIKHVMFWFGKSFPAFVVSRSIFIRCPEFTPLAGFGYPIVRRFDSGVQDTDVVIREFTNVLLHFYHHIGDIHD
ncbi:MAG: hypothetical protein IPJ06_15050 [Saprospiraceae bacterium]|nr:hypothetical protein [Saprospiraceae bacterium]